MLQAQDTQHKRTRALPGLAALIFSALLVVCAMVGGTHAYLMSKTDTYVNTFVSGLPDIAGVTLSGTKTLEGRALAANEFAFDLHQTDSTFDLEAEGVELLGSARNDAEGGFSFEAIEFDQAGTYHYVVTEEVPNAAAGRLLENVVYDETQYRVTVTVTEQDGKLVAQEQIATNLSGAPAAIAFANKFDSPDATFVVNGMKRLDGRTMGEGEFGFKFEAVTERAPMPAANSVKNEADGSFSFGVIRFSEPGTYEYAVSEVVPEGGEALGGVTYDESVYSLSVEVTADETSGLLSASATMQRVGVQGAVAEAGLKSSAEEGAPYVADDFSSAMVVFENGYAAAPVDFSLVGSVGIEGRDLVDGEFSFVVEPKGDAPAFASSSDANDASGGFGFGTVKFEKPGAYEYEIIQVIPEEGKGGAPVDGLTYDESVHRVTVTVADDGEGNLVIESVVVLRDGAEVADGSGVKYVNRYEKPGEGGSEDPVVPPGPGGGDGDDPELPDSGGTEDGGSVIPGGAGSGGTDLEQTGDTTGVVAAGAGIVLAAAGVIALIARRKSA